MALLISNRVFVLHYVSVGQRDGRAVALSILIHVFVLLYVCAVGMNTKRVKNCGTIVRQSCLPFTLYMCGDRVKIKSVKSFATGI